MGAAQGSNFPYEPTETVTAYEGKSLWKLQYGVKKVDKSPVSIFSFDLKKNAHKVALANNNFKRVKTLRHPNIVAYLDGIEMPDAINIVTEELVPLENVIDEVRKYPNALIWGIYQVAKALSFLNNDCNFIHGNLSLSSVFVNKAGDWKLGGLDMISPHKDAAGVLRSNLDCVPATAKPPELQKVNWALIEDAPSWAIDAWLLACFIYEIYNGKINKMEDLKVLGKVPKSAHENYKEMLHSNPKMRLNPQDFLESQFFQNSYVETCQFLETIALKEPYEKDKFFKALEKQLDSDEFPQAMCKYKILPQLVIALDFGQANSRVLGPLLKIGKGLTPEEYNSQIIPSVIKWFASPDLSLRLNLLQNLEHFIEHLTPSLICDQIFPTVATGFDSPSPVLREITVRSMLLIVPKLNERTINTILLKYLAKSQMDPEFGIRINTTVLLAKIASYLSQQTRQKILAAAFSRSLKDPHPKARVAGLLGLEHTLNYYNKEDCVTKILPSVALMLVDPEKECRDSAFRTIKQFIKKLEKISETGVDENAEQAPKNEGMLGWAWGSLSKKIYGDTPGQQPPQTPSALSASKSVEITDSGTSTPPPARRPPPDLDGWDNDAQFNDMDNDLLDSKNRKDESEDDFTTTVYTPKKPLPAKSASSLGLQKKDLIPKNSVSEPALKTSSKSQNEGNGWDDITIEEEEPQVYPMTICTQANDTHVWLKTKTKLVKISNG